MTDYDIGTFTSQFAVGSSVKGGTLLAGYQNKAIKLEKQWSMNHYISKVV